jgi:branched-chain amino acid transport system permease protein
MTRNKLGYYFQAVREDEDAAAALGVNVLLYKIIAVSLSAGLTAMGGTFFAQRFQFIDPTLVFGVAISIDILLRPIFGGAGTIWGPLVGAIILTPLEELTRSFVRNPPGFLSVIEGRAGIDVMIFGVILIVVVIYMPEGVVGTLPAWIARIRQGTSQAKPQEATE